MSNDSEITNRREFLAATGVAVGAAAVGSAATAVEAAAADDSSVAARNALLPTPEQMQAFLALPDEEPIVMVNLLKFKPDGGQAEYAKYSAGIQPILQKLGAKILFAGKAQYCLIGHADWDMVVLVQYPRKKSLFQMSMSPEYRAIHHHREADLLGQINYAVLQTDTAMNERRDEKHQSQTKGLLCVLRASVFQSFLSKKKHRGTGNTEEIAAYLAKRAGEEPSLALRVSEGHDACTSSASGVAPWVGLQHAA